MPSIHRSTSGYASLLCASTFFSCIMVFITAALTTRLATTLSTSNPALALAIAASVVNLCACCTFLAASWSFYRQPPATILLLAWLSAVISSLLATILSMATFAWTIRLFDRGVLDRRQLASQKLATVGLPLTFATLLALLLYFILIWPRSSSSSTAPCDGHPTLFKPSSFSKPQLNLLQPTVLCSKSPPKSYPLYPDSFPPPYSPPATTPASSLCHSLSQAFRPVTSRTRLSFSKDSRTLHLTSPIADLRRNNDEFEHWDTSAVEEGYKTSFTSLTRLETIPGSRPASPVHQQPRTPDGQVRDIAALPPPELVWPVHGARVEWPRSTSRSVTPVGEAHIHPLFRSESPVPPPSVSPGTVITASPHAKQVVSPEIALSSRYMTSPQSSRPSTPKIAIPHAIVSRPASVKSFRMNGGTFL